LDVESVKQGGRKKGLFSGNQDGVTSPGRRGGFGPRLRKDLTLRGAGRGGSVTWGRLESSSRQGPGPGALQERGESLRGNIYGGKLRGPVRLMSRAGRGSRLTRSERVFETVL